MKDRSLDKDVTENTLRIGPRELGQLLDILDSKEPGDSHPSREFVRWSFRAAAVIMELSHPGGSAVRLPVATRNLASGGISVLHRTFLHTGSKCAVTLPHPDLGPVRVEGEVVRCKHIGGTVHEIGIAFHEPVNVREYMQLDPMSEAFSLERVDPTTLRGTLVVLDSQELDRKLIQKLLNDTNMKIKLAATLDQETTELIRSDCDLVLCEYHLDNMTGVDAVRTLRKNSILVPIVMMTSDTSTQTREKLRSVSVNGFLQKPLTQERLLRGLAEFLLATGNAGPLYSTLKHNDAAIPLVEQFVNQMPAAIKEIEAALASEDLDRCRKLCFRMMGSAPTMGFPGIGHMAAGVIKSLDETMNVSESVPVFKGLIAECRRVRMIKAAS